MSSGFFRGTNTEQDSRWGDAEKKLLRRTKFSKVLNQKVNMKKVNMDVMQRWITQRITSLLGFEDDIVVGTCVNYLSEEGKLDPKKLQLQLTGFLEKSTGTFMEELWGLLVDAQNSLGGIPSAFLQDKKQEMLQAKEEQRRQEEELHRKMAEHQQEMEFSKLVAESAPADSASSSGAVEQPPRPKAKEGRRASRWGKPEVIASSSVNEGPLLPATSIDGVVEPTTEVPGNSVVGVPAQTEDNHRDEDEDEQAPTRDSSVERGENVEDTRKNSRSRREEREDDIPKERKRKSKSKHGKKSDRKKSKRRHRDGEERGRRRLKKIDEDVTSPTQKSGDENSSSDDDSVDQEVKDGVGVEEALRLKALAAMANKKGLRVQDDRC